MRSLLLTIALSCLSLAAIGAERTWTGGAGLGTSSWESVLNWNVVPVAGDALIFPSATYKTASNTFPAGTTFGPLTIDAGGYVLTGNLIDLNGGIFLNGANTAQVTLPLEIDDPTTFTVTNQNGTLNINQPISGTGGIIKSGNGLLVMNGNHSYTGPTVIAAGGLQVGGNLPGTVQIGAGNLLGIGSVDGIQSLNLGARLAPGTNSAVGTLTSDGNVTLKATDGLLFDILSTGADKLVVNGTVDLGQAGINPTIQYTPSVGTTWVLIENDGSDPIVTGFTPSSFLIPTFLRNNQRFQISFVGGAGRNDVVLQKVGPQNTTVTSFTTSDSSIAYGDPVTFTVMLTGVVNGGTVTFWDGNEFIDDATVVGSQAQLVNVTTLKPGARSITALFEGNATYAPVQSGVITQNVGGTVTTTGLTAVPATSAVGSSTPGELVTLTATVSGSSPTGTVTFYDGTTAIGAPVAVSSNQAVTTTTALIAGAHTLSATFNGTGAFFSSGSTGVAHTVVGTDTTISVASSLNPAVAGDEVTFTATVTGGANAGSVVFRSGVVTLGTVTLSGGGTAALVTGGLSAGTHGITAQYLGTTTFEPSTSSTLSQTITARPDGSGGGPVELEESSGCGLGGGVATLALALLMLAGLRLRRDGR